MIRIRVKNIFGQIANRLKHTSAYHGHKKEGPYKQSYISPRSHTPLIYETIGQRLDRAAELYENRDCFIDFKSGERLTFKELKQQAEDLASGLIAIGLNRGDRIGLWAPNCIEWVLTQYATALAGIIQVNINPAYKTNELEYSLNKVGCKAVIMSETFKTQNYVKMLTDLCPEVVDSKPGELNSKKLPQLKSVIVISDKKTHDGFYQFEQVLDGGDSSHRIRLDRLRKDIEPSDTINIQYTSGTTGHPKGVELSHHMILNNALQTTQLQEYDTNRTIICLQVPLYHCFGMVIGSLSTITSGTTCVFPSPSFDPEQSFKSIFKEKCTSIYGTPTMFVDLLNHQDLGKYDLSSVNTAVIGGSTSPSELMLNSIKKLNTRNIICAYGLTETSPVITTGSKHDSLENRTQTIGRALDHLELKVVDKLGKVVGVNEPGELLVRGYNTMIGYWDEKGKTDETFTPDRFLKTGDIVKMDEYGYFHHLSRLKDVVIRGGENIYPKEVEDFLHTHPKIADVYVVGVPDARMGEELCACVRLVKGEQMSPQELKDYCKDKISHFKIPRYIEFTDDFPITVTGKVQKNKLREFMTKKLHLVK